MLMPSVDFRDSESLDFQINFVMCGGLKLLLSFLTDKTIFAEAGNVLKRCRSLIYTCTCTCTCMHVHVHALQFCKYYIHVHCILPSTSILAMQVHVCTYMYMYMYMWVAL